MPETESAIESASASTACQTNDSKFAYVLSAAVLGGGAILLALATLLAFTINSGLTTNIGGYDLYGDNGYEYYFEDEGGSDEGDPFDFDTDSGTPA